MADQHDTRQCLMCFKEHTSLTDQGEPIICKSGHSLCSNCVGRQNNCLKCRGELVSQRQNQTANDTGSDAPEISIDCVKRAAKPFASGGYAKVYEAEWQNQSVALKVLRQEIVDPSKFQDLLQEVRLAMSLNHPNVVRVFGVVPIDCGKGILMEKADRGSLRSALDAANKLSLDQQVSVSIDIVEGLDFIHSKQMLHQDLKPENVLLFDVKSQLTAKIADFGTSKLMQSSLAGTTIIGTPYYKAPELFKPQAQYGSQADVYSVAMVLYEVFSGRNIQDAYLGIENAIQLAMCVESGQRPEIPESFPEELRTVVERGWSADANVRPTLADFRQALFSLKTSTRNANPVSSASTGTSGSGDADVYAAFEAQLHKLEPLIKGYRLIDARSQIEACRCLLMRLDNRTTATVSTAWFHSVKGYVHHWFGECPDAYKETHQALTELYELCLSGTSASVEGEQVVTILRYAVEVCCLQDQFAAAEVLVSYAVRYAKSKLSVAAYADALECLCCFIISYNRNCYQTILQRTRIRSMEFVLSTRLKASADKPQINVATAYYYLAMYFHLFGALQHLEKALDVINKVEADNVWAAVCKSLKGEYLRQAADGDEEKLQATIKCLEDALGIAERTVGKYNKTVADIYFRLARTLRVMERTEEAEVMFKKAIEAAENSIGPNCSLVARYLEFLANMYDDLSRFEDAEESNRRSIEIYKSVYGPSSHELSPAYFSFGDINTNRGQTEKAATNSQLGSEVESGKLETKFKSIDEAQDKLLRDVIRTVESDSAVIVIEAPGELVDVLHNFFKVAPTPTPTPTPL